MRKEIYPNGGRDNYLAPIYHEMAMESYYLATTELQKIVNADYLISETTDAFANMHKHIISTIVFSAMTVESFLNNYAAACLGDDVFYENFDKLSSIGKFQLIVRFVLKTDIDKSKAHYSLLKKLFHNRDKLIHSKSKSSKFRGYGKDELLELKQLGVFDVKNYEELRLDNREIREDMQDALDALKCMHEIAIFFDNIDSNAYVTAVFFPASEFMEGKEYAKVIYPLLGIACH